MTLSQTTIVCMERKEMRIIIDADELVKVVRCENCRYYMEYHEVTPHCYQDGRVVDPTDFCSWGIIKDKSMYKVKE